MTNKLHLLGTLVVAGTALAACGSSAQTSAATTTTAATKTSTVASKPNTTGTTTSVASTPAGSSTSTPSTNTVSATPASPGFNASKTVFVLPHNLGDLPAPELALAKSDPAYAAGLLTPADWENIAASAGGMATEQGWFYMSTASGLSAGSVVSAKMMVTDMWLGPLAGPNDNTSAHFSITSNTPIAASSLNAYPLSTGAAADLVVSGYTVVTPSVLEVRAAPVGTMSVNGRSVEAFCTPTPEGVLQNGHIVTPGGVNLTAGPSAVFTMPGPNPNAFYDQGVSSCAGFN